MIKRFCTWKNWTRNSGVLCPICGFPATILADYGHSHYKQYYWWCIRCQRYEGPWFKTKQECIKAAEKLRKKVLSDNTGEEDISFIYDYETGEFNPILNRQKEKVKK